MTVAARPATSPGVNTMIKKTAKRLLKLLVYAVIPVFIIYQFIEEQIYQANMPMGEVIGPDHPRLA